MTDHERFVKDTLITRWIAKAFDPAEREKIIEWIRDTLKNTVELQGVDTIAVRGISGIVLGSIVAHVLNLKLVVVRKDRGNSHAHYIVEGLQNNMHYVILDDLISSGNTINQIVKEIAREAGQCDLQLKCSGVMLYHGIANADVGLPIYLMNG